MSFDLAPTALALIPPACAATLEVGAETNGREGGISGRSSEHCAVCKAMRLVLLCGHEDASEAIAKT